MKQAKYLASFCNNDGISRIAIIIEQFNEQRLAEALLENRMNINDIRRFVDDFSVADIVLSSKKRDLLNKAAYFNKSYAPDHVDYFNISLDLLKEIKCGIRTTRKFIKNTQAPIPLRFRNAAKQKDPEFFLTNSPLYIKEYQLSLFNKTLYPNEVQQLFLITNSFFQNLNQCLMICIDTLRLENHIRQIPQETIRLYKEMIQDTKDELELSLSALARFDYQELDNSTIRQRKLHINDLGTFTQQFFHNLNPSHKKDLCLWEICHDLDTNSFVDIENKLWPEHDFPVNKLRDIIAQFDNFIPNKERTHKKINAEHIALLVLISKPKGLALFANYFQKIYSNNGKYTPAKEKAIHSAKQKLEQKGYANKTLYHTFYEKIYGKIAI